MAWPNTRFLQGVIAVAAVALVIYGYRDYQRGAVSRYFQSDQFFALADLLPKTTLTDRRVSMIVDDTHVTVRVDARTQEEFNALVRASRRPGRPSFERLQIFWNGVQYEF